MSRSLVGFVAFAAVGFLAAGCQHHQRMDAEGNPLPTYVGSVVQYPPEPPHFEAEGQSGWVNLTKARPGEVAEAKAIKLEDHMGKRLTVQGLLMPRTGWIYEAEIVKEEK